ncbi:methyltransferase family protein [Shimia aestuarii]|uniref:methyltransferase family protein n=1 Tax=Shimia aestuarii TaxID=254406 RepID=UPI001FB359CA|nr:PEMT/PEM2 methyltransferase family protein [Shimia aestuarii]
MILTLASLHALSFALTGLSGLALAAHLALSLARPDLGLWPASSGWRHHLAFGLFRLFCGGTVVFALCALAVHGVTHWGQFALGLPIMIFAFGLTLRGYRFLGLDNTYCESGGLVTGGMYAYSRNPQYVTSVIATIGLAITCGSPLTGLFALALFALYFLFVLNEERWLISGYGQAFRDYMKSTPRFVDARSLLRAKATLREAF